MGFAGAMDVGHGIGLAWCVMKQGLRAAGRVRCRKAAAPHCSRDAPLRSGIGAWVGCTGPLASPMPRLHLRCRPYALVADRLAVNIGAELLKLVPGRVRAGQGIRRLGQMGGRLQASVLTGMLHCSSLRGGVQVMCRFLPRAQDRGVLGGQTIFHGLLGRAHALPRPPAHAQTLFSRASTSDFARQVSTEADAHLSYDAQACLDKALRIVDLYSQKGIGTDRIYIKVRATLCDCDMLCRKRRGGGRERVWKCVWGCGRGASSCVDGWWLAQGGASPAHSTAPPFSVPPCLFCCRTPQPHLHLSLRASSSQLASTWEGIRACEQLQKQGIDCNMTLLFSFAQVGGVWRLVGWGGACFCEWDGMKVGCNSLARLLGPACAAACPARWESRSSGGAL